MLRVCVTTILGGWLRTWVGLARKLGHNTRGNRAFHYKKMNDLGQELMLLWLRSRNNRGRGWVVGSHTWLPQIFLERCFHFQINGVLFPKVFSFSKKHVFFSKDTFIFEKMWFFFERCFHFQKLWVFFKRCFHFQNILKMWFFLGRCFDSQNVVLFREVFSFSKFLKG